MLNRKPILITLGYIALIVLYVFVTPKTGIIEMMGILVVISIVGALIAVFIKLSFDTTFKNPFMITTATFFLVMIMFSYITDGFDESKMHPSSNPYADTRNCTYCGQRFSGTGYFHIESSCETSSTGDHCSKKCCSEDWARNGKW